MPVTQSNHDYHSLERSMKPRHKLLSRQIRKYLKSYDSEDEAVEKFLDAVNESYSHYERDRKLLERSMDITFKELAITNARLRDESQSRKLAIDNLRIALDTLRSNDGYDLGVDSIDETNLVSLAEVIHRQVAEIEEAENKLIQQNQTLRKINSELDRFVYSASHDLRAPLISVLGLVQLIKMEELSPDTTTYIGLVERSINKLDRFIKDIVDYSRNSRMGLELSPVDFNNLISEVAEKYAWLEGFEKIDLTIEVQPTPDFQSDVRRLSVVFSNLIGNAIQYADLNKELPYVRISVAPDTQGVVIRIEDNGRGIPQKFQEKIFDMFFRAASDKPGSGLGLYIVQETVDRLQGTISLESEEGKGTVFTLRLPHIESDENSGD